MVPNFLDFYTFSFVIDQSNYKNLYQIEDLENTINLK